MASRSLRLTSSSCVKKRLVERLKARYGDDFKSPLARDLKVNVSTIRRIFNQREGMPYVYEIAIEKLLENSNEP